MNEWMFAKIAELEAKLDLERQNRWRAEQRVLQLEKELADLNRQFNNWNPAQR